MPWGKVNIEQWAEELGVNILGVLGHDVKITTRKVRDLEYVNA